MSLSYELPVPQEEAADIRLNSYQEVELLVDARPILESDEVYEITGLRSPAIAEIFASSHQFLLLDSRNNTDAAADFILVDDSLDIAKQRGYKGIWEGDSVTVGRSHMTDRFDYDSTVSRDHFQIGLTAGKLILKNFEPTNGTFVSSHGLPKPPKPVINPHIRRDYTSNLVGKIANRTNYGKASENAPNGYHMNHPVLGANSISVKNGVYFTSSSEVILVDDRSDVLQDAYKDLKYKLEKKYGEDPATIPLKEFLKDIMKHTAKVMKYDLNDVERISAPYYENKGLVPLSKYVVEGVGVCRHQCLLAALFLENAVEDGYLTGVAGVQRNRDLEVNGGHAWTVFKAPGNPTYIVDPAQKFVGTNEEAIKQKRWRYEISD